MRPKGIILEPEPDEKRMKNMIHSILALIGSSAGTNPSITERRLLAGLVYS
jgi:hypothetical protein